VSGLLRPNLFIWRLLRQVDPHSAQSERQATLGRAQARSLGRTRHCADAQLADCDSIHERSSRAADDVNGGSALFCE
jgi:hypothetical protein